MHATALLERLLVRLSEKPWDAIMAACPDCRWITLKPHGPDHPDYRHVLIKPTTTGFRVVWAGSANLMHLRVHVTEGGRRRERQPMDESKREALRQRVSESWAQERDKYAQAAAKLLGYDAETLKQTDADDLVAHLLRAVRVERTRREPEKPQREPKQPEADAETPSEKSQEGEEKRKLAQAERIREAAGQYRETRTGRTRARHRRRHQGCTRRLGSASAQLERGAVRGARAADERAAQAQGAV
jgi:hypothetical protein